MAEIKQMMIDRFNKRAKQDLINDLKDIIKRVENDEIEMFAAVSLDNAGDIAGYHSRIRKTTILEVIGLVDILKDYLKDETYKG